MENAILVESSSSDEREMYREYNQTQNRYYVERNVENVSVSLEDTVCFLCGSKGHLRQQCNESICYNCYKPGHLFKNCDRPRRRNDDICLNCKMLGHVQRDCDLRWRRYIFVSKLKEKNFSKLCLRKNCYCCSSNQHMGDECPFRKKGNYSIYHTPMREYLKKLMYKPAPSTSSRPSKEKTSLQK